MGFLDRLKELFAAPGGGNGDAIWLHFRCDRCGATVRVRVNRRNDLNRETGGPGALLLRKEVMDNKCFQLMRAEVWFDASYNVVSADVSGGSLISEEEYLQAKADAEVGESA